jgi:3-hydroxyisobutyrate dehydrogenase
VTGAPRIGFVGLGAMGRPMARRLVEAGHAVTVFDIADAAVRRFVAEAPGATAAASLAALADADLVITMLPDSGVVDATVAGPQGLAGLLRPGATIVDMSSSEPARTRALAQRLDALGIAMLDAPVSGGVKRAVDGTLAIMVGGPEAVLERWRPVLALLGRTITHVGAAGAGHAAKALNNYVSAAGLVAACEALVMARAFGLDPGVLNDVLNQSTGRNNSTENKVRQFILSGRFDAGFSMRLMGKDLATAREVGRSMGLELPLCEEVSRIWEAASAGLPPDADHTEVFRHIER